MHNHEHLFFANLHAKNPLYVTHECTLHERASLVTQYISASTSNKQVKRVHTCKKSYKQVYEPLSTGALRYLRGIDHRIICLFTHYNLSQVLLANALILKRLSHNGSGYQDTVSRSFMNMILNCL